MWPWAPGPTAKARGEKDPYADLQESGGNNHLVDSEGNSRNAGATESEIAATGWYLYKNTLSLGRFLFAWFFTRELRTIRPWYAKEQSSEPLPPGRQGGHKLQPELWRSVEFRSPGAPGFLHFAGGRSSPWAAGKPGW